MDSAANVHVCNNLRLMTDFAKRPTRVGGSTSNRVSPGRGTVRIRLALEDGIEGIILNLRNVFYFPNSPSNLINLSLLNNAGIYYENEQQVLYDKASQKPLVFAQQLKRSFLLHPLNLSVPAANFLKAKTTSTKIQDLRCTGPRATSILSQSGTKDSDTSTSQL